MMRIAPVGLRVVIAAALAVLLGGCAQPSAPVAVHRATVGLTYIPNVQFAPFYLGESRGLFDAEGVDVTLRHHGGNEGLFTALAAGQEDLVIAGGDELLQANAEGMDLVAVAQYYRKYPIVLIVPDASPIRTAADLKGRSVGIPGRYGES